MANILVVDDLEDNVFLLKMVLENLGHSVLTGYSGQDALDIMEQHHQKIDLLLLDIMMPGLSGLQVATALKSNKKTRHIPIILLTAKRSGVKDVVEGLDAGADEYLTKPFKEPELGCTGIFHAPHEKTIRSSGCR